MRGCKRSINKKMAKDERIKAELERISVYFADIADNQRAIILPLLQNAAFMKVTLEDLQELINDDGLIDEYQNGENQKGLKVSAALQSYNTTVKNYGGVIKQVFSLLPKEVKTNKLQQLLAEQEA